MGGTAIDEIREQKSLFDVNTDEDSDEQTEEIRQPKSIFDVQSNEDEQGVNDMQTLGLCDNPKQEKPKGFWRRQFQKEPTRRQKQYDWAFGVILPLTCFFFDPFIFRFWNGPGGLLGAYKPFAYSGSAIAILSMVTWLLWREKLGGFGALFAGLFFAAATISFALGLILLPFSLFGLIVLVGALGFTPLFTAVIFLRNGVRALRAGKLGLSKTKLAYASIVGTLWGLAIPFALQMEVNRSLEVIAHATPETIRVQGWKLRLMAPIVDADQLHNAYSATAPGSSEREEIERLYKQLDGGDIRHPFLYMAQ